MKGFHFYSLLCFCFMSASAFSAELITNNVTNGSILPPHAKLLAGNASDNEFYILGNQSEQPMMVKPDVVKHMAVAKASKKDIIKIEMAFNHSPKKHTFAKRAIKGHLYVSNSRHKSSHKTLMG